MPRLPWSQPQAKDSKAASDLPRTLVKLTAWLPTCMRSHSMPRMLSWPDRGKTRTHVNLSRAKKGCTAPHLYEEPIHAPYALE